MPGEITKPAPPAFPVWLTTTCLKCRREIECRRNDGQGASKSRAGEPAHCIGKVIKPWPWLEGVPEAYLQSGEASRNQRGPYRSPQIQPLRLRAMPGPRRELLSPPQVCG